MKNTEKLYPKFTKITNETELTNINGGSSLKDILEAAVKIIRSDDNEKNKHVYKEHTL